MGIRIEQSSLQEEIQMANKVFNIFGHQGMQILCHFQ